MFELTMEEFLNFVQSANDIGLGLHPSYRILQNIEVCQVAQQAVAQGRVYWCKGDGEEQEGWFLRDGYWFLLVN